MRWSGAVLLSLFTAFGFVACSSGGGGGMIDGGLAPIGSNVPRDAETQRDAKRDSRTSVEEEEEEEQEQRDAETMADSAADAKKPDSASVESGVKVCVSVCSTDFECQSSCPPTSIGITCCDVLTGVCYATSSGSCAGVDAGPD